MSTTWSGEDWRIAAGAVVLVLACLPGDDSIRLVPGLVDVRSLAAGEGRLYRVSLAAEDVLHLRIEQRGLDVAIRFPDDRERPVVDLPYGKHVTEELWWLADRPRDLLIEVRALAGAGGYRLNVSELGPATARDRRRSAAFSLALEGSEQLANGRLEEAVTSLEAALELWHGAGDPVREAVTWSELGKTRVRQEEWGEALAAFESGLSLLGPTPERGLEGRLLHWRGRTHKMSWRLDRAASDYRDAGRLFDLTGDAYGTALVTNDLAVVYDVWGELQSACDSYGRARQLFIDLGSPRDATRAQLNLGRCYTKLGALPEALTNLQAALRGAEDLSLGAEVRTDALREIGWWHRLEGRPQEALKFLTDALELEPESGGILDRLGTVHTDLGDLETARRYYGQALDKVRGNAFEEADVEANLCRLEELAGRLAEGLERCRRAFGFFEEVGARGTAANVLLVSARLEHRNGRLREAEALAEQAMLRIESQRPLAGDSKLRSVFLAKRLEYYRLLIDLRMELHSADPHAGWDARALAITELIRARSLLDLLNAKHVDPAGGDPRLRRTEQDLLTRIDRRSRELAVRTREHGQPVAAAKVELAGLEERLVATRHELRRVAPAFAALTQPMPLDIPQIQELLDDETLLVVYHLGEQSSYVWLVSRREVGSRKLVGRDALERLAETWYGLLSDPGQQWARGGVELRRARQLSRWLLEPVAEEIGDRRRLLFIADGALQRIPFGALPIPADGGPSRPLIVEHEVVMLPSVAVLAILRQRVAARSPAEGLLAAVADPVYDQSDERLASRPAGPAPEVSYRRLYNSGAEARDLLALAASGRTLLLEGFSARLDRVTAGALEGFRIVHFATHGRTAEAADRPVGLVLALLDERGEPIEGILGLQELYNLHLPAELVVLSACGTALGEEIQGEGLMGLTRGFMYAGTPRVLVSLWAIRDRATRELMRRFYRALLHDRRGPGQALRQAQASMWQEGWATSQWGAFVLQGDWRPFRVAGEVFDSRDDNKGVEVGSWDSEPRERLANTSRTAVQFRDRRKEKPMTDLHAADTSRDKKSQQPPTDQPISATTEEGPTGTPVLGTRSEGVDPDEPPDTKSDRSL